MNAPADRQYLRKFSLIVGGGGTGLELGELRVTFQTHKADFETPNNAEIRVYNLSDETARKIGGEFTRVVMQAGYEGNFGLIFGGTIRQTRRGRERGVDSYLDLLVADGDKAYNYAVVNTTLAAGATQGDIARAAMDPMREHGVTPGYFPELGGQALPRGVAMYGMSRGYLRDVADTSDTSWSIQDGKVQMIPRQGWLPGDAVELTAQTGLVGMPEQTEQGIKVRCLINPRLRVGSRIKLNNSSILLQKKDLRIGAFQKAPRLNNDGLYRVLAVEFRGDTRGNDWYADLTCVGIDDSAPIGSKLIDSNGGR